MFLTLLTTGCLTPLAKHSTVLATATAPVIHQAAAAYASANSIHNLREDYDAVAEFDAAAPAPVYNPRAIQPLLTDKDIQARLTVLAAFQVYVKSLVAITSGTDSPELQAASKSAGENLSDLGNSLAPSAEAALGLPLTAAATQTTVTTTSAQDTTTTTSTSSTAVSPAVQSGISTAVDALGQFLVNRKVKQELPHIILVMDPHLKVLCDLLDSDIAILTDQETRDYNFILNQQTDFVLATKNLDPGQRRDLIMQLPEIVRREQASSQALRQLSASIVRLQLAHHALAVEAEGDHPESLKDKLGDLEAAGSGLGNFYSSLSAKSESP